MVPNGKRLSAGTDPAVSALPGRWHVVSVSLGRQILGSGVALAAGAAVIAAAAKSVVKQVNSILMMMLLLDGCGMR
jgi:hypothetical protein